MIAAIMQKVYDVVGQSGVPSFAYLFHYLFWEQYVTMVRNNAINLMTVAGVFKNYNCLDLTII
jgi:hypothetical protein